MELVEHMFFSCLLTQQVWHYAVNIFWQLCVKRGNHGPWKSMMQCLFDQPMCNTLKHFSRIWFFLSIGLLKKNLALA